MAVRFCQAVLAGRIPARLSVRNIYTASPVDRPVLVVGVVEGEEKNTFDLTSSGQKLNNLSGGDLVKKVCTSGGVVKAGASRLIGPVHQDLGHVVVVGLARLGRE